MNKKRKQQLYNRTSHRLRELEKVVRHRWGVIPDTDDADVVLEQVARCYAHLTWKAGKNPTLDALMERLGLWCSTWAPDASPTLRQDVCHDALRRPRLHSADECARRLRLAYDERAELRITTIGSIDADKAERTRRRKARKRVRDRERAAEKRAERGATPRAQYLAESLSATRPWEAEGMSRRAWYRRRSALHPSGTSASRSNGASILGDTLATSRQRRGRGVGEGNASLGGAAVIFLPRLPFSALCSGTAFDDGLRRRKRVSPHAVDGLATPAQIGAAA